MKTTLVHALLGLCALVGIALGVAGCSFHVHGLDELDGGTLPNAYACACDCSFPQQTPTLTIAASSDDAEEDAVASGMNLTDPVLHIFQAATRQFVGLRFTGVQVPPGATIQSAQVQFSAAEDDNGSTLIELVGQAADDAPTFTTDNSNLSTRPETSLATAVQWTPAAWTSGEQGAAELSPDLSGILNEIVSRPGWMAGNAVVLILRGTGKRVATSFDGDPTRAPKLLLTYQVPGSAQVSLQTCMPGDLNPELNGGTTPTDDQLRADCQGRVTATLDGLSGACNYPSACSCDLVPDAGAHFVNECSQPCAEVPLAPDCSNFDPQNGVTTATNAPGDLPVCIAHSPISDALYGQRSLCEVEGEATFHTDDETKTSTTRGSIELEGRPCPGGACAVGMSYLLDLDPITFDSLFSSATFSNLAAVGESMPSSPAMLAPDGTGTFAPGSAFSTARGTRGSDSRAVFGANTDPIQVAVGWAGAAPSCSLSGALLGTVDPEQKRCENAGPTANQACSDDSDCTDDPACSDGVCNCLQVPQSNMSLSLALSGALVNQPPSVQAGADQVVECNQPGAATFTVSATPSDPDQNLRFVTWLRGGRAGTTVGFTQSLTLTQALDTSEPYTVRVIDARAQADESTTHVQVVDTTAPVISCNAPPSLTPPSTPVRFSATASDVCDPTVVPVLTGFSCFRMNGSGKQVDLTQACAVTLSGNTLTLAHTNGVGEHIRWTASVTDHSGNSSTATCETVVERP